MASGKKSNILILRSIVCEIPFCCPESVTVSLIRNDSLGGEGRFHWRRLLSGGDGGVGWGGNSKGEVIEELGSHPPQGSGS